MALLFDHVNNNVSIIYTFLPLCSDAKYVVNRFYCFTAILENQIAFCGTSDIPQLFYIVAKEAFPLELPIQLKFLRLSISSCFLVRNKKKLLKVWVVVFWLWHSRFNAHTNTQTFVHSHLRISLHMLAYTHTHTHILSFSWVKSVSMN